MSKAYGNRYLFLAAILFLLASRVVAGHIRSTRCPRDDSNQSSSETVQQLLSDQRTDDSEAIKLIFKEGDNALPTLLSALKEGNNIERASWALAYLGGPSEHKALRDVFTTEKNQQKKWLIASFLAGALVEPASAEEWQFLEGCLRSYKIESRAFASFSAAVALGINASPHALNLLQSVAEREALTSDNDTIQQVREDIRWIKQRRSSSKAPISAEDVSDSEKIKRVVLEKAFFTDDQRRRLSVEEIAFTRDKRRALVSVQIYGGPKDAQTYNFVVTRTSGMWKVVGAWFSWAA